MEKKKMKSFFTLDRRASDGFTLVELIVVIAILAILGVVAVPAYSGYVKKANMQADITLAAEVAHGLTLYYYNNSGEVTGGYVVLSSTGVTADENGKLAMAATFGDGWESLSLKYDGWTGGLYNEVAKLEPEQIENISNSTFLTHGTTEGMVNAATGLLDIAAKEIAESDITSRLEDMGIELDVNLSGLTSEEKGALVSNMLVGYYADAINNGTVSADPNSENFDPMVNLMNIYANAYAYTEFSGDDSYQKAVEQAIVKAANDPNGGVEALKNLGSASTNWATEVGRDLYREYGSFDSQYASGNISALQEMMGAIGVVANGYTDKESLTNPDLFASQGVMNQVSGYMNAIKLVASGVTLPSLSDGQAAIVLYPDGTVYNTIG